MTKYIKAIRGHVNMAGRVFSEGVSLPVSDEIATSPEVTKMQEIGFVKVFDTLAAAQNYAFTGIAALARGSNSPTPSAAAVHTLTAAEAAAKAARAAQLKANAAADAAAVSDLQEKLTAAQAKAKADAALLLDPTAVVEANPATDASEVVAPVVDPTVPPATN